MSCLGEAKCDRSDAAGRKPSGDSSRPTAEATNHDCKPWPGLQCWLSLRSQALPSLTFVQLPALTQPCSNPAPTRAQSEESLLLCSSTQGRTWDTVLRQPLHFCTMPCPGVCHCQHSLSWQQADQDLREPWQRVGNFRGSNLPVAKGAGPGGSPLSAGWQGALADGANASQGPGLTMSSMW